MTDKLARRPPERTSERGQAKPVCAIGLQVGTRKFLDTGITATGVFGLTGWEDPCPEPVTVRCQLAINGRPAPYFWYACANPMHQRDAYAIENLETGVMTPGVRVFEEPISPHKHTLGPVKKKRKPRKKRT